MKRTFTFPVKNFRAFAIFLFMLLTVAGKPGAYAQNYTGNFQLTEGGVTITLTIKQNASGSVTGTMTSNNGSQFSMEGKVAEGIATGVVSGNEGALFFEAYLDGNDLTLSLIEPDQNNMPNYDAARFLILSRSNQPPQGVVSQPVQPTSQPSAQSSPQPSPGNQMTASPPMEPVARAESGTEVVRDDVNGFSFTVPQGWVHQTAEGQILLGSNTIPGIISVFPHQAGTMQEMQSLMQQGLQEEGVFLSLDGGIQQRDHQMITGTYQGSVQGEQARGYGIGLLGQYGGGIFILAVSTPQKLGSEIIAAADNLAANTRFSERKTGDSDLVKHFAGEWVWTNAYRTEWMTFFPDGTYSDQNEASYSGDLSGGGNWGVAGQDSNRGRWNIQGNLDAGVITVINPDGSQTRYEYHVHVERGEKYYREYEFNGSLYQKQKNF